MKTIKIKNINIKEINISKQENEYIISVVYALLDENDREWDVKRTSFKITKSANVKNVLQMVANKLK